jgi:predicted dehydrogenase
MTKKIRVGVAGAGFIGTTHARAYCHVPGIEFVGIADPQTEKAAALVKETGGKVFKDYNELLAAGLDVINICLPPQPHLAAAEAAAAAGVHVLMEKPIARTLEEADQMIAACDRAGVYLMTGFTHHFYPEMREAKRLIDEGMIGKPLTALDSMSISYSGVLPWYRDREIAGGGVFMCNAVHGFDRVSWVLGQNITAVAALIEPTTGNQGEDYGSALARFDGGAQGTFFQHWSKNPTTMCDMQIFGEEGNIHVRSWNSIEVQARGKRYVENFYDEIAGQPNPGLQGMIAELTEMTNAVREGRQPQPDGHAGRTSIKLVQAVYQAAEEGRWVTL